MSIIAKYRRGIAEQVQRNLFVKKLRGDIMLNTLKRFFSLGLRAAKLTKREAKDEAKKTEKFFAGELKNEFKKVAGAALRVAGRADKSLHERLKKQKAGKKKRR